MHQMVIEVLKKNVLMNHAMISLFLERKK